MEVAGAQVEKHPGDNMNDSKELLENLLSSEDGDRRNSMLFSAQSVSPRTIAGPANVLNKGAIDW